MINNCNYLYQGIFIGINHIVIFQKTQKLDLLVCFLTLFYFFCSN